MEAAKIGPDVECGQVSQTRAVVQTCLPEEIHRRTPLLSSNQEPITLHRIYSTSHDSAARMIACVVSVSNRAFALPAELSRKRFPRRLYG